MLLLGEDGTLRFDLGNGLQCTAELTSYRLLIGRDRLETTAQGDESRTYVAGLKSFSGELNFNIRLAEQDDLFTAAQLIPSVLALEGEAPIPAEFYLQRSDAPGDCPPGISRGPGWFSGVVLLDEITLDIGNAAELIRGAAAFTGTGDLEWNLDATGAPPPVVDPPEPPPVDPGGTIVPADGIYSQSSVYSSNVAADAASMTNNSIADTSKTATNVGAAGSQWIEVDYGALMSVKNIIVGDYTSALAGGWGNAGQYLSNVAIQHKTDATYWQTLFVLFPGGSSVPPLSDPVYTYAPNTAPITVTLPAPVVARYLRLVTRGATYLACTEFYATSTTVTPPPPPPAFTQPYFETGRAGYTYSDSNRTVQKTATSQATVVAGAAKSSGKWYIEFSMANAANASSANDWEIGVATEGNASYLGSYPSSLGILNVAEYHDGFTGVSIARFPALPFPAAIIGLAYDADARKLWIGINGVYQAGVATGDPVAGTNPNATWSNTLALFPGLRGYYSATTTMTIPTSWTYQPAGYQSWA
jgi:hypothetical protein